MVKKKIREWKEGELIRTFGLTRIAEYKTARMESWMKSSTTLDAFDQQLFDKILQKAVNRIGSWSEEDLKMKFISFILELGNVIEGENFVSCFEKTVDAEIEGHWLRVKTDFVIAQGVYNLVEAPYFHFQEYKPQLNPSGEPMAQLLEAMLIAQARNNNQKPIYGCEVIGRQWSFVIMEGKSYCVSKAYDSIDRDDLLKIIAILRHFRYILETELISTND
jgi:hypothetical protein